MPSKRIVIDANILVRAVLGIRVRELIERYCGSVGFYVAEANVEEAVQYLGALTAKRGMQEDAWRESLTAVMTAVQIIPQAELTAAEPAARARIGQRAPSRLAGCRWSASTRLPSVDGGRRLFWLRRRDVDHGDGRDLSVRGVTQTKGRTLYDERPIRWL